MSSGQREVLLTQEQLNAILGRQPNLVTRKSGNQTFITIQGYNELIKELNRNQASFTCTENDSEFYNIILNCLLRLNNKDALELEHQRIQPVYQTVVPYYLLASLALVSSVGMLYAIAAALFPVIAVPFASFFISHLIITTIIAVTSLALTYYSPPIHK